MITQILDNNQEGIGSVNQNIAPLLVNSVVSSGNLNLLKQLVTEGADLNLVDYGGRGPIHVAAIKGDVEVVRFLVEQGVNVDALD